MSAVISKQYYENIHHAYVPNTTEKNNKLLLKLFEWGLPKMSIMKYVDMFFYSKDILCIGIKLYWTEDFKIEYRVGFFYLKCGYDPLL